MIKTYLVTIVRSSDVCVPGSLPIWAYVNVFQVKDGKIINQNSIESENLMLTGSAQKAMMLLADRIIDAVINGTADTILTEETQRMVLWAYIHEIDDIGQPIEYEWRGIRDNLPPRSSTAPIETISMRHIYGMD